MAWHLAVDYVGGSPRWRVIKSRLFGIAFLLMGIAHLAAGVGWLVVELRHPPTGRSPFTNLVFVASGLFSGAIGGWLCTRIAFRPDLGDIPAILGKAGGYNDEYLANRRCAKRTWWTGDPLPSHISTTTSNER